MHLVTGTSSGLGRYLKNAMFAMSFSRFEDINKYMGHEFDSIIHCSYNVNKVCSYKDLDKYVHDNFILSQALLKLNFKKFIFISSSDIYPSQDGKVWDENSDFDIDATDGLYSTAKKITESLIRSSCDNSLIIRPTAMLGMDARKNSLMKILSGENQTLSLSADSKFNYILHEDIFSFIKIANDKNLTGIFNAASNDAITLGEVAEAYKLPVKFGSFTYQVRELCNKKIKSYCEDFNKKSIDNIHKFHLSNKGV